MRVREGEKRKKKKIKASLFDPQKFRWSEFIEPKMKVLLFNEGYVWVQKTRNIAEDSSEKFGKSKVSGLGSVHGTS